MVNEMLLMMSGDIEPNPGPSEYFYCLLFGGVRSSSGGEVPHTDDFSEAMNSQETIQSAGKFFHRHFQSSGKIGSNFSPWINQTKPSC